MINRHLDTNHDLIIFRYENGIKLIEPEQLNKKQKIFHGFSTGISISHIFKLPIKVYFLNAASGMQNINDVCAAANGFNSIRESFGKTMFDISPQDNAQQVINTDISVLKTGSIKIVEDTVILFNGSSQYCLTIKSPWYSKENNIVGVFGFSILFGEQPVAESLVQISKLGLLDKSTLNTSPESFFRGSMVCDRYLSKREREVLDHFARGKTAKSIAKVFSLSHRTIEQYLENIKNKLKVKSKSELIEKIIHYL